MPPHWNQHALRCVVIDPGVSIVRFRQWEHSISADLDQWEQSIWTDLDQWECSTLWCEEWGRSSASVYLGLQNTGLGRQWRPSKNCYWWSTRDDSIAKKSDLMEFYQCQAMPGWVLINSNVKTNTYLENTKHNKVFHAGDWVDMSTNK